MMNWLTKLLRKENSKPLYQEELISCELNKQYLFNFVDINELEIPADTFAAYLDNTTSEDIIDICSRELKFPDYDPDPNWGGFFDYLCDWEWIEEKNIYMIHISYPKELPLIQLKIYLRILGDSVALWQKYPNEHVLKVFFEKQDEKYLRSIIEGLDFYYLTHEK